MGPLPGLATHVACGSVTETSLGGLLRLLPPLEPAARPATTLIIAAGGIESREVLANRTGCLLGLRPVQSAGRQATRFFLSTSALIRLASTENASPPTSPAAMHIATTPSNTRRKASLSRKRSCRARLNTE